MKKLDLKEQFRAEIKNVTVDSILQSSNTSMMSAGKQSMLPELNADFPQTEEGDKALSPSEI